MLYYENKSQPVEANLRYNDLGCPYHFHQHIEVVGLLEGQAAVIADSRRFLMNPGDFCIVFPHQVHAYENRSDNVGIVLLFSQGICGEFLETMRRRRPVHPVVSDAEGICRACAHRLVELAQRQPAYADAQQHAQALLLLSQLFPRLELEETAPYSGSLLQELIQYCQDHYTEPLTLELLSQQLHVSRYYLSHLLNQQLHMNLNEYLASLRIADACHWLADETANISEVAFSCGFNSIRSFNRHFSRIVGLSPIQWRKRSRAQHSA